MKMTKKNIDINNIKMIKFKSGEEIHGIVKSTGNFYTVQDPIELEYNDEGEINANKWCWISVSRSFKIDMRDTMFPAQTVLPVMAEQYIKFISSDYYENKTEKKIINEQLH